MTRTANRRAVTLVEVLIAIFLMGIGLMAILSLFPLGAAQMAQAIKDQRCAEAATNADALSRIIWKQTCDADANGGSLKFTDGTSGQAFVLAMDNPNVGLPGGSQIAGETAIPRSSGLASYPVVVDPFGVMTQAGTNKVWLPAPTASGVPQWRIPRRSLSTRSGNTWTDVTVQTPGINPTPVQRVYKLFSLLDDMTFNYNGTPDLDLNQSTPEVGTTPTTKGVERQGRYTWSYMFRRNNNADRATVDISVIVYSGRSIDVASPETAYPAAGDPGSKSLTLSYTGLTKPAIRRGQWVLDATLWDAAGTGVAPQGYFYRAVNVDDSVTNQIGLELQTPLLGGPSPSVNPNAKPRSIVVLDNVVEVFTRQNVTPVTPPQPY
jgi:hypothetical protein